jgi:RimJ/RimL family protein N-acetyltransferase
MPDPDLTLNAKRVTLRSTRGDDLSDLMTLWNDGRVMHWVGFPEGLGYTDEKAERWLAGIKQTATSYHFCARTRDGEFLGEVFCRLDPENRRAGLDIKFVPDAQGRGLSRESLLTLIDWVFAIFPEMDAVWTEPRSDNLAARTLYYSCGLRQTERPAGMHEADSYWERRRE